MIEEIRESLSRNKLKRQLKKKDAEQHNFKNFFHDSSKILLIIPDDKESWKHIKPIVEFLKSSKKEIYFFISESLTASFRLGGKKMSITYNENDVSKLKLPGKTLMDKISTHSYDIIIDLNLEDNLFSSAAANIFESRFRIGFIKDDSDLFYNFQIPREINNEISYRNLLNSLTMF